MNGGEVEAELRSVVEQYLDAMNHDDGPRIAKLTMGAAFFDLTFDERSISQYHQVEPFPWYMRSFRPTDGNAILRLFELLTYSDDIAVASAVTGFEKDPPGSILPEGVVMFIFQRVKGQWRISTIPRYCYNDWSDS